MDFDVPCYLIKSIAVLAKLKTKKNPHISVIVVNTGDDTKAGSNLTARRMSGIKPPKHTETKVLAAKAKPTTMPNARFHCQRAAMHPINIPMGNSLKRV